MPALKIGRGGLYVVRLSVASPLTLQSNRSTLSSGKTLV